MKEFRGKHYGVAVVHVNLKDIEKTHIFRRELEKLLKKRLDGNDSEGKSFFHREYF
ncbi:Protein of unknown function [Bacillus mycoides]|nr:Protein of unknown function [Bacillus mycoides]